jgi:hypothetical protein
MKLNKNGLEKRIDELYGIIKGYEIGRLTKKQVMVIIEKNCKKQNGKKR